MDKIYRKHDPEIDSQADLFYHYLNYQVLDGESRDLLRIISNQTKVYIFSGIIRNFLTNHTHNIRDIDIVVQDFDNIKLKFKYWRKLFVERNSFGGYKITFNNLKIDVWSIKQTWGIRKKGVDAIPEELIKTAFFNFSGIVYDYNKRVFIYGSPFIEFYHTRIMDVVFWLNPNPTLCVLNTIYYATKYGYPLKYNLCVWLANHYSSDMDFDSVSIHHFGHILFDKHLIYKIIQDIKDSLPIMSNHRNSKYIIYL